MLYVTYFHVMHSAAILNVIMLSVNMLNVIMLSVAGVLLKASLQLAVIHFIRVGILKNVLRTLFRKLVICS